MKSYEIVLLSSPGPKEVVRGTPSEIVAVLRHLWNARHAKKHLANPYVTRRAYWADETYMKDIVIAVLQDTGRVPAWTMSQITPERFLKFMVDTGRITFAGEEIVALGSLERTADEEAAYRNSLVNTLLLLKDDDEPMPQATWL